MNSSMHTSPVGGPFFDHTQYVILDREPQLSEIAQDMGLFYLRIHYYGLFQAVRNVKTAVCPDLSIWRAVAVSSGLRARCVAFRSGGAQLDLDRDNLFLTYQCQARPLFVNLFFGVNGSNCFQFLVRTDSADREGSGDR